MLSLTPSLPEALCVGLLQPQTLEHEHQPQFPILSILPWVREWEDKDGLRLTFETLSLKAFQAPDNFCRPDTSPKRSWRALYKPPLEKWAGDLQ